MYDQCCLCNCNNVGWLKLQIIRQYYVHHTVGVINSFFHYWKKNGWIRTELERERTAADRECVLLGVRHRLRLYCCCCAVLAAALLLPWSADVQVCLLASCCASYIYFMFAFHPVCKRCELKNHLLF